LGSVAATQLGHTNTVTLQTFYGFADDAYVASEIARSEAPPLPAPAAAQPSNVVPIAGRKRAVRKSA
jgi:hypothetical protein